MIKHSTVKCNTIKLLGENVGEYLHDLGTGKWFLKQDIKNTDYEKKNKLDFIKIMDFCISKATLRERKCKPQIGVQRL